MGSFFGRASNPALLSGKIAGGKLDPVGASISRKHNQLVGLDDKGPAPQAAAPAAGDQTGESLIRRQYAPRGAAATVLAGQRRSILGR